MEGSEYAGEQKDFGDQVYPRSYPVPGRLNLRRAMRAYVQGHDRGWDVETKARLGAGGREGYQGPGQAVEAESPTAREADALESTSVPAEEAVGVPGDDLPEVGVGVPDRHELDFHRGADTWRDRIRAVRVPGRKEGE